MTLPLHLNQIFAAIGTAVTLYYSIQGSRHLYKIWHLRRVKKQLDREEARLRQLVKTLAEMHPPPPRKAEPSRAPDLTKQLPGGTSKFHVFSLVDVANILAVQCLNAHEVELQKGTQLTSHLQIWRGEDDIQFRIETRYLPPA